MMKADTTHLHFVQSIEPLQGGGLGRAAVELHQAFARAGTTSRLVTTCGGRAQAPDDPSITEFVRSGPSMVYHAPGLRRSAPALVGTSEVVHAHGLYTAVNWALGAAARKLERPLVYHVHGFFEPWILDRSKLRKRLVHVLFENANFEHARLWRALTSKEADQIRAQGITAPVVVAANGIDLSALDVRSEAIDGSAHARKSRRRMLFLARLHPKKGLGMLVPAWAKLGQAVKDWELVIAGPDELGHLAEVQALVRRHGLEERVRFTGSVTGAEKIALLRSADVFVLPSHSEGFSVAILEAMASRVPVAATYACNFPELENEAGGWLCEPDTDAVSMMLLRAVSCPDDELRERGQAARRLVETRFTWPSISKLVLDACAEHCRL
jgi:glycosyltransferase involved in cell wall biosynthesis